MDNKLIDKLEFIVEEACQNKSNAYGYGIWSNHIKPMIPLSQKLANLYNADIEVVTIATILHDLAGIQNKEYTKNHHIIGAEFAVKILKENNYPMEKVKLVADCIRNHRGSINNKKYSIEEICVADADAIIHMIEISSLYYVAYKEMNMSIDEGRNWISGKIDRDWKKMSQRSKELYEELYKKIKEVIRPTSASI
jgi:uncharacterized protein